MKNHLIILIYFIISSCINNTGNNNINSMSIDTVQLISSQKKEYSEINSKLASYRKVEKVVLGQSAEGGDINAFYDHKELKKIITTFYGETGKAVSEYYFNNDGVFFVFSTEYFYNKPIYIKGFKIISSKENSYYLFKNQLIKWIDYKNKSVNINAKENHTVKKNLLDDINEVEKSIKE